MCKRFKREWLQGIPMCKVLWRNLMELWIKTLSLNLALTLGYLNPKNLNPNVTNPNPNPNNCGYESN